MSQRLKDILKEKLPEPLPLFLRLPQEVLVYVKVVDKQSLPNSVDHHANVSLGVERDLEQFLDVFRIRHNIHVPNTIRKLVGHDKAVMEDCRVSNAVEEEEADEEACLCGDRLGLILRQFWLSQQLFPKATMETKGVFFLEH